MTIQDELKDLHTKPVNFEIPNILEIPDPEPKKQYNFKYFEYVSDYQKDYKFEITEKYGEYNIRIFDNTTNEKYPQVFTNIKSKDIFSPKTRKEVVNFFVKIKKVSDETEWNKVVDELYKKYQKWISLKAVDDKNKAEIEELLKKGDEKKLSKQKEEERLKFEEERPKDILDVIQTWDRLFGMYSNNNLEYSKLSLHIIVGQEIINSRLEKLGINIDPRISIMYFKPSGTGGSAGWNITNKIAESLGLMCNTITNPTDAALIGSVETEEDPDTKEKVPVYIKGLLDKSRSNIISWSEAKNLFETIKNQHEGNTKNYIMSALNLIGDKETHLERPMKSGIAFVDCEASMTLATVKPRTITDDIINSGFMQRFNFINKIIDIKERAANAIWDINSLTTIDEEGNIDRKDQIRKNQLIEEITKKLKYLKYWGEIEENKTFYIRKDAVKYFNIQEQKWFNQINNMKNTTDILKEQIATFQTFTVRKSEQIAMHHAALRFSNIIEIEDIKYACEEIIQKQMDSLISFLEETWTNEIHEKKEESNKDKFTNAFLQYLGTNEIINIPKKDVIEIIKKIFHREQNTAYKYYKIFINQEAIIEDKDGNVTLSGYEAKIYSENITKKPENVINTALEG